jgi:hypothetical protein
LGGFSSCRQRFQSFGDQPVGGKTAIQIFCSCASVGDLKRWARESFSVLAAGASCQKHDERTISIRRQRCPYFRSANPAPRLPLNSSLQLIHHIHLRGLFRFLRPGQSGLVRFWNPAASPPRSLGRSGHLGGHVSTHVIPTALSERLFADNQAFPVPRYPTKPRTLPRD